MSKSLPLLVALSLTPVAWAAGSEGSFEKTFTVRGPVEMRVATGSGSIRVRRGTAGRVHVAAKIKASYWGSTWLNWGTDAASLVREVEQNPPLRQNGDTIVIGNEVRKWERISISYEITTPDDTRLTASSGSGSVEAADLRGPVALSTGSGSVQAEKIGGVVEAKSGSGSVLVNGAGERVTASTGSGRVEVSSTEGDVDAHSGSGNVTVIGAGGSVKARTSSGSVRVEKARADLEAHSASGNVSVEGAPKSARWDISTSSGGVNVHLPRGAAFELDARTSSGSVSTSHAIQSQGTTRKGELRGVVGRPESRIHVRAASGSIKVD